MQEGKAKDIKEAKPEEKSTNEGSNSANTRAVNASVSTSGIGTEEVENTFDRQV